MPRPVDTPPQLYARHLTPLGRGYPLWTPELGAQFLRYRRDGLRIGDVGVVDPGNGSFDVFFNICLPREHPFHRVNGVPDNFTPVQLNDLDVGISPIAENPGRVINSTSVTKVRKTEPPSNYEFSFSSGEGALLILPHGAERYSLLKHQLFSDVATQHGEDWYHFARQRLGRIIGNDSLYLITGFYKSRSWSVAAFHETTGTATEFPAHFKAEQVSGGNITTTYTWDTMRSLHWRVGPLDDWGVPSQSVFITGFKIALRDNILGKRWVEVVIDAPPALPRPTKYSSGSQGRSGAAKFWKKLVSKGSKGGGATDQGEEPGAAGSSAPNDASGRRSVTVTHEPQAPRSVHPSDIVNRYLLRKDPNATISITHDSQWTVLLQKGLLKPEDLEDEDRLEKIMSENYRLLSHNGVISLKSISDVSIRVVDLSDAAFQAWKADKLMDAEEILSKQIVQTTHSGNHSIYASRALIRARSEQWDAALRDAEMSIGIQSSVIAYIAKGFALFGLEKYGAASQALNLAIRDCDLCDKDFALLVKSVVLFQAKYHAESMACIADLLEHCPTNFKSACSSVQAQMYLQLATSAMKNEDHERGLPLLEKARSLGPFDEIMDLDMISLISGWKFDNLQYIVYQQHCEGLYITKKIKEAAIAFETMTQDLGEHVKARKGNAEWLNEFRHQCLRSLESLGDVALWSKDYPEAITPYSAALKMDPNSRDRILVKRSTAYGGIGALDDALNDANEATILNPSSPWGYEGKYKALRGLERYDEAIGAFSNMLSILEQAVPHSQQLRHAIDNTSTTALTLRNSQPPQRLDPTSAVESIFVAIQGADINRAINILSALRTERDEMIRDKNALVTGREPKNSEATSSSNEFPTVILLPDEQVRGRTIIEERDRKLLKELTALVKQNPDLDKQVPELMKMLPRLADKTVVKHHRNDISGQSSVQDLLDELQMHNTKQREILEALSDYWSNDEQENGSNKVPRNFRTLREEISDILADEVKKIMGDVVKLGEERRRMQHELGQLMTLKSKYRPGGEFDPEWIPPGFKAPPSPGTPERPTGRFRKRNKPYTPGDSNQSLVTTPGWRSVMSVRPDSPPPVVLPERDFFGLFGPLTPREAPTALPDSGLAWEPKAATRQLAQPKEASATSPLFQAEHDDSPLLSPPQPSSSKQARSVSSPPYSPLTLRRLLE